MSCNEWKEVMLGDVIYFNPRETLKKGIIAKKIGMDKIEPFNREIQGYEVAEFKSGTKFRNGDTLLARITPCLENGKTAQVRILDKNEVAFGSTEFIVMREKTNKTVNDFIYYLAISEDFRNIAIKSMTGTSGRQRAQKDVLEKTVIKLPPLEEQKAIAHILSTLDEKIEVNNKINKTLEEMAQSIFKHWFIDFEFPNEDGEPYKSSGGEMVESELGMIPKGWEVVELGNIIKFKKGKKPKEIKDIFFENCEKYLTIDVLNRNSKLYANSEKMIIADKFDTLMVMDGASSGTVYYGQNGIVASTLARVDIHDKTLSKDFIYYVLKYFEGDIKANPTGSAIPHTDKEYVYSIKICIPHDVELLKRFNNIARKLREKVIANEEESVKLSLIRDTILPKLMSGEIRIPINN